MIRYTNKQITTAEMITKLLDLARWVREAQKHGAGTGTDATKRPRFTTRWRRTARPRK